jgi:Tfp pilus assembly protein PilN
MIRINLLADRHAKDRLAIQQQLVLGVAVLIGSIVLCGFWWQAESIQIDEKNKNIEAATTRRNKQKLTIEKVKKMEAKKTELDSVLKAIESLVEFKRGPAPFLDDINVMLPSEIWLTNVTDTRGQLTLQGYSFVNSAVAKLMKSIESSKTDDGSNNFSNVELRELVRAKVGAETMMKFNIQCLTSLGAKLAEEETRKKAAAEASKERAKADAGAKKISPESLIKSGEAKK